MQANKSVWFINTDFEDDIHVNKNWINISPAQGSNKTIIDEDHEQNSGIGSYLINTWVLMDFSKESSEFAIPDMESLARAIQGFLKMANIDGYICVFKIWRLNHIQFLLKGPMKKSDTDI